MVVVEGPKVFLFSEIETYLATMTGLSFGGYFPSCTESAKAARLEGQVLEERVEEEV